MGLLGDFSAKHQRLKERIHNFRLPLSRRGRIAMNVVYFAIPVIGGHYLMEWAQGRAQVNLTEAGVLPEPGESRGKSRTELQNKAIKRRLGKIKKEIEDAADREGR